MVESSLLGPFPQPIQVAESAPADAPIVCTVETVVDGVGEYETPSCPLPEPGYYVWVERIDPEQLTPELGGLRVLPWHSAFGVASEISQAIPVAAPVTTPVPAPAALSSPALAETGVDSDIALGWSVAAIGCGLAALIGAGRVRRALPSHRAGRPAHGA